MFGIGSWTGMHTLIVIAILVGVAAFTGGLIRKLAWIAVAAVAVIHALAEFGRGG